VSRNRPTAPTERMRRGPLHLPSSLTSLDALASAPSGCNQNLFRRSLERAVSKTGRSGALPGQQLQEHSGRLGTFVFLKLTWPVRKVSQLQRRVEKRRSTDVWVARVFLEIILVFVRFINTLAAVFLIPRHFFNDMTRVLERRSRAFLNWKKALCIAVLFGFLSCFDTVAYPSQVVTTVDAFWMAFASHPVAYFAALAYLLPALAFDLVIGALLKVLGSVGIGSQYKVRAIQWLSPFTYSLQDSEPRASAIGWAYCMIFVFMLSYPVLWFWPVVTTRIPSSLACMIVGFVGCLRPYRELLASMGRIPPVLNHRRVMERFVAELSRQVPTANEDWSGRYAEMRHQWRRWRSLLSREERRARSFGDKYLNQLLKERCEVYQSKRSELVDQLKTIDGLPAGVASDLGKIFKMLPIGTFGIS